jgi:hypothetical protein
MAELFSLTRAAAMCKMDRMKMPPNHLPSLAVSISEGHPIAMLKIA